MRHYARPVGVLCQRFLQLRTCVPVALCRLNLSACAKVITLPDRRCSRIIVLTGNAHPIADHLAPFSRHRSQPLRLLTGAVGSASKLFLSASIKLTTLCGRRLSTGSILRPACLAFSIATRAVSKWSSNRCADNEKLSDVFHKMDEPSLI